MTHQLPDFNAPIETGLSGLDLINRPMLNKGTAFSEAERDPFQLRGVLPPQAYPINSPWVARDYPDGPRGLVS